MTGGTAFVPVVRALFEARFGGSKAAQRRRAHVDHLRPGSPRRELDAPPAIARTAERAVHGRISGRRDVLMCTVWFTATFS
jgi:hypothetical protein